MDRRDLANPTASVAVDRGSGRDPILDHRDIEGPSSIPEFISTENALEMRFSFELFSSIPL
jgi:hypothetical protein